MRKSTLMAWTTGALVGWAALAAPVAAQTAAGNPAASSAGSSGATTKPDTRTVTRQSDADYKKAQARCNSRQGADKQSCLEEVKARHQQAKAADGGNKTGASRTPTSPDAVPAVQTQSSAVSATGVAPSTTGPDPTPGTPAVPRK
jgi:hypothetical protein